MSGARLTHTCTRKVTRHEDEANKQQQQKGRKGWVALDVVLGLRGWVGGASWDWSGKRKQMHLMTQFLTEMPGRKTGAWKTVIPAKRNSKLGKIPDISLSLSLACKFGSYAESDAANSGKSQTCRGPRNRLPVEKNQQSEAVLAKPASVTKRKTEWRRVIVKRVKRVISELGHCALGILKGRPNGIFNKARYVSSLHVPWKLKCYASGKIQTSRLGFTLQLVT